MSVIDKLPNGQSIFKNSILKDEHDAIWRCVGFMQMTGNKRQLQLMPEPPNEKLALSGLEHKKASDMNAWEVTG